MLSLIVDINMNISGTPTFFEEYICNLVVYLVLFAITLYSIILVYFVYLLY